MPRYLIERSSSERLAIPDPSHSTQDHLIFIENNTRAAVTWLRSYIARGGTGSFCIYDAPSPEAIRRAAEANGLPVARITEVRVLDP